MPDDLTPLEDQLLDALQSMVEAFAPLTPPMPAGAHQVWALLKARAAVETTIERLDQIEQATAPPGNP